MSLICQHDAFRHHASRRAHIPHPSSLTCKRDILHCHFGVKEAHASLPISPACNARAFAITSATGASPPLLSLTCQRDSLHYRVCEKHHTVPIARLANVIAFAIASAKGTASLSPLATSPPNTPNTNNNLAFFASTATRTKSDCKKADSAAIATARAVKDGPTRGGLYKKPPTAYNIFGKSPLLAFP